MGTGDHVIVYRGFDPTGLDLVESMLRAEGLAPQRLGKAQPALLGIGNSAIEQLIAVAPEHEAAARALIGASQHAQRGEAALEALEAEALGAAAPAGSGKGAEASAGLSVRVLLLLVAAGALGFFAFRYGLP